MTDLGSSAVRDQLAEVAARRLRDRERLAELTAAREALAVRVIELEDEVGRLRATVAAAAMPGAAVLAPPVPFLPAPLPEPVRVPETVAVPVPTTPSVPGRRRLRLRPSVPGVLFVVGALAAADGVTAVVWQEPVSALYGTWQQDRLGAELAELDRSESGAAVQLRPEEEARLRRASARERAERRMAASAAALEARAKPGQPLGRMRIPRIGQSLVVVEGTGDQALRTGPGRYATGAMPGQDGTFGVAGHRTSWSAPFREIDRLRNGDRIVVTMPYGRFTYRVSTKRIVKPEDVWVLSRRRSPRIVLTACHPLFSAAKRIVVSADLVSATPRGAARRAA